MKAGGDFEGWLRFFLRGVAQTSDAATRTARQLLELRESGRARVMTLDLNAALSARAFDVLFAHPVVTVNFLASELDCAFKSAGRIVEAFAAPEVGLLRETTGAKRNRRFRFQPLLKLFEEATNESVS